MDDDFDCDISAIATKPEPGELLNAIENDKLDEVKDLLRRGADVNEADSWGNTALITAAYNPHKPQHNVEIAQLLIDNGARLDDSNRSGMTALMWAAWQGFTDIVHLLLKAGASLEGEDPDGRTIFDLAQWFGHPDIVQILQEAVTGEVSAETATEEKTEQKSPHDITIARQNILKQKAQKFQFKQAP